MKYTVVYSTEDIPENAQYVPIEVPEHVSLIHREDFVRKEFSRIFWACFGDSLGFHILDIYEGYERREPEKIQ